MKTPEMPPLKAIFMEVPLSTQTRRPRDEVACESPLLILGVHSTFIRPLVKQNITALLFSTQHAERTLSNHVILLY